MNQVITESTYIPKVNHHYLSNALASLINRFENGGTLKPPCTVPLCRQGFTFTSFHSHSISNAYLYYHILKKINFIYLCVSE